MAAVEPADDIELTGPGVRLAVAHSRALRGLSAPAVRVEIHLANGLPQFMIVGLPEASVRESRERVRAAILQSGFEFPHRRITVNLAPADLPKDSGRFDLPIAIGILAALGHVPAKALGAASHQGGIGPRVRPDSGREQALTHPALPQCPRGSHLRASRGAGRGKPPGSM